MDMKRFDLSSLREFAGCLGACPPFKRVALVNRPSGMATVSAFIHKAFQEAFQFVSRLEGMNGIISQKI